MIEEKRVFCYENWFWFWFWLCWEKGVLFLGEKENLTRKKRKNSEEEKESENGMELYEKGK